MPKDGVVGIGLKFEYKEALDKMVNDLNSQLATVAQKAAKIKVDITKTERFQEVLSGLSSLYNEIAAVNDQKINADEFVKFQTETTGTLASVIQSIELLKTEMSDLESSATSFSSGLKESLNSLRDYLLNFMPTLEGVFKTIEMQTGFSKGLDVSSVEKYRDLLKEAQRIQEGLNSTKNPFSGKNAIEMPNVDTVVGNLKQQMSDYEDAVKTYQESGSKMFSDAEIKMIRARNAVMSTINTIQKMRDMEVQFPYAVDDITDNHPYIQDELSGFVTMANLVVQTSDKLRGAVKETQSTFNTFKIKDGAIHVPVDVIKSEQAAERLNEVIKSLQELASKHPIYAEVQLVAGTKKSGYQKNEDIAKELDTDKNPIDLGGSIRKAYKDALKEVKKEAQGLIDEVMSNFEKRKFPIHPDSEAFTKELQEMVNTSMGEVAGNETGLNINKDLEGLVKNLQAVAGILSGSKNFTFGLDEASIERITASINSMANMIQRAFGVASDTDIANQWSAIENRFKAVAGEEGKLLKSNKEHKAAIQEIVVEYQKYLDMGGRNDFSALTKHARTVTNLTEAYEELIKAEEEARKQQEQQATQKEEPVTSKRSKGKGAIEKTTEANQKLETQAGRTSAAIKLEAGAAQSASEKFRKLAKEKGNAAYANRQLAEAAEATAIALEREAKARKEGAGKTTTLHPDAVDKNLYLKNSQIWQEDITSRLEGDYAEVYGSKISQRTNGVVKFSAYVTKLGDDVSNLNREWKLYTATVDQYGNVVSPVIQEASLKQIITIEKQKIAMERYLELLEKVREQEELQPLERKQMENYIQSLIAEDKNLERFRIKDIQLNDKGGLSITTGIKEADGVVKTFRADFDSVNDVINQSGKLVDDLDQKLENGFSSGTFTTRIKDTSGEIDTLQAKASRALGSFEKKFKDSANFSKIKRQVDSLRGSIDKIGDQSGLDKWLGRLDKAESKIKNLDIISNLQSKASKALGTFTLNNKDSSGFSQVEGQLEALKGTITSIDSQAGLDRFNEQLREIELNLKRINTVSKFHTDNIDIISQYKELYDVTSKISNLKIERAGLDTTKDREQVKLLDKEIKNLEVTQEKLWGEFFKNPDINNFSMQVMQELDNVIKEADARIKEIEAKRVDKGKTYRQNALTAMARFEKENEHNPYLSQVKKEVDELRSSIDQIDSGEKLKKFNNDLSAIKGNLRTIKADDRLGKVLIEGHSFNNISEVRANIDSLFSSIGKVNEKSIRINGANKLTAEVKMANGEIHKMNVSLDSNNFARYVDAGIVQFGRLRDAAGKAFKGIWQMMRIYISPYRFVQLIRQGVNQIKEMDTAITELRKVSDAPLSDISAYFDDAVASAKELGSSVKDMIGATADWARLGMKYCSVI